MTSLFILFIFTINTLLANDDNSSFLENCEKKDYSSEELALIEENLRVVDPNFSFKQKDACSAADNLRGAVFALYKSHTYSLKTTKAIEVFSNIYYFPGDDFVGLKYVDCSKWKNLSHIELVPWMMTKEVEFKNCKKIKGILFFSNDESIASLDWRKAHLDFSELEHLNAHILLKDLSFLAEKANGFGKLEKLSITSQGEIDDLSPFSNFKGLRYFYAGPVSKKAIQNCPLKNSSKGLIDFCKTELKRIKKN